MNFSGHLEQRCYRKASLQHRTNLGGQLAGPRAEPGAAVLDLVALYQQKTSRPHQSLAAGWYRDTLMWKVTGWEVWKWQGKLLALHRVETNICSNKEWAPSDMVQQVLAASVSLRCFIQTQLPFSTWSKMFTLNHFILNMAGQQVLCHGQLSWSVLAPSFISQNGAVFGFCYCIPPPSARWEAASHATHSSPQSFTDSDCPMHKVCKHQKMDFIWPDGAVTLHCRSVACPRSCWWAGQVGCHRCWMPHMGGQDPIGAEPHYNWSWWAADGTAVEVVVLSVNHGPAYTHTPGTRVQERAEGKQVACPVPTMGKGQCLTTANLFNWVSKNTRLLPGRVSWEAQHKLYAASRLTACRKVRGRGEIWLETKLLYHNSSNKLPRNTNIMSPYSKQLWFCSLDSISSVLVHQKETPLGTAEKKCKNHEFRKS